MARSASRAKSSQSRPISSGSPSSQSAEHVRLPAPRRADVGHEAVLGPVEPAGGEVAVADHGARELAREAKRELLVDRRRDRVGRHPAVPAAQPLDRPPLALVARAQPDEPVGGLDPGQREHVGLQLGERVEVVALAGGEHVLDPPRPVAVEPVAADVVRVALGRDPVVRRADVAALGIDHLGHLLVGDPALPFVLARPPRARQVGRSRRGASAPVPMHLKPIEPWRSAQTRLETGALWGASDSTSSAPARHREHPEARLGDAGPVEAGPAQRERLGVVGSERLVDDRAVSGRADDEPLRLAAPDLDRLLDHRRAAAARRRARRRPAGTRATAPRFARRTDPSCRRPRSSATRRRRCSARTRSRAGRETRRRGRTARRPGGRGRR